MAATAAGPAHLACIIGSTELQRLIGRLQADGFQPIGPTVVDGAVALAPVGDVADLPFGTDVMQAPGRYRLAETGNPAGLPAGPPANAWKRWLYPPEERLWHGRRSGSGFVVTVDDAPPPRYALFGVLACDLAAIAVLDRALGGDAPADPRYAARRRTALVIALNCTRVADTCFCASMACGPAVRHDCDLVLTELADGPELRILAEARSPEGQALLRAVAAVEADADAMTAARASVEAAAVGQRRAMVADVAALLGRNAEHPHWLQVAERCLACGNCTLVCPTCFCSTVEDVTDLAATATERRRLWDSCFTLGFSYIHGGSIRHSTASRYRQWLTHKLSAWWEQFGSSGCVGCGRCIVWCPVGIDITEEARAFAGDGADDQRRREGRAGGGNGRA